MNHHNAAVTQWFENRKEGLEQGFTLQQPPNGERGEAVVLLETEGSLQVQVAADGSQSIRFVDAAGLAVVH